MFRIGEFAQIAQVSGRQLRFYDQLGLLRSAHTDPQTGYRYYSMRQLPRLNSILALKELGLSLEQIGPLLENEISPAELRAMLTMKRAQVEQSLREEEATSSLASRRSTDRAPSPTTTSSSNRSMRCPICRCTIHARTWRRRCAWSAPWPRTAPG
jgi:DNA-binding transcriptional MerR regulator